MIRHSVIFSFREGLEQSEKDMFFSAVRKLSAIPGVEDLIVQQQVSPKNKYQFSIAMKFANEEIYNSYNDHPEHRVFIDKF